MNKEKCKIVIELEYDLGDSTFTNFPRLAREVEDTIYAETPLDITKVKTKEIFVKDEWKSVYLNLD